MASLRPWSPPSSSSSRRRCLCFLRPICLSRLVFFLLLLFLIFFFFHNSHTIILTKSKRFKDYPTALLYSKPSIRTFLLKQSKQQSIHFTFNVHNGLGAQILHLLDAVSLAHHVLPQSSTRICITESHYWNYGCAPNKGWTCYFSTFYCPDLEEQQQDCKELSSLSPSAVWTTECIQISTRGSRLLAASVTRRLASLHPISEIVYMREVASTVWKYNQHTLSTINYIFSSSMKTSLTTFNSSNYIAVHIRRGDKAKEVPLLPIARYAKAIIKVSQPGDHIYVATDDIRVLPALRKLLHPRHSVILSLSTKKKREGHRQIVHNRSWMKTRYLDVVELLTDVEMMRRANVFVGTFSSNLGRLVHTLRGEGHRGKDGGISVSLDDRWAPGVAWRTFGQQYCKWPGANETFCKDWQ